MTSSPEILYFGDRVKAVCHQLGLPDTPPPDLNTDSRSILRPPCESPQGRLVRMLEEHLQCVPTKKLQLGERFRVIERLTASPFGRITKNKQILLFDGHYTAQLCRVHPHLTFVFGDNAMRIGKGGQATIRDQPNVLGVATKRTPGEYFVEGSVTDMGTICEDLVQVEAVLKKGGRLVLPITSEGRISLGCGLAQLPYHMPTGYAFIERWFDATVKKYGTSTI